MSGPSQRAAERQAARRGAATTPRKRGRVRSAADAVRDRPTLTGRAVVLAVVLGMLVLTLAVPLRELVAQRAEINALRAQNAAASERVAELVLRKERLADPAYVTSLIRTRLHYVLPGEVGYVVLDPEEAPAPVKKGTAQDQGAWYSTLWQSVAAADGAASEQPADETRTDAPR